MGSLLAAIGLGGAAAAPAAGAASPFITQAATAASPYYATGVDAAAVPVATAPVAAVPTSGGMSGLFGDAARFANTSPSLLQGTGINYGQLAAAANSRGNTQDFAPMWNAYMQQQDAAFKKGMTGLGVNQEQAVRDQAAANKLASDLGFTNTGVTTPQVGNVPGLTPFQ